MKIVVPPVITQMVFQMCSNHFLKDLRYITQFRQGPIVFQLLFIQMKLLYPVKSDSTSHLFMIVEIKGGKVVSLVEELDIIIVSLIAAVLSVKKLPYDTNNYFSNHLKKTTLLRVIELYKM